MMERNHHVSQGMQDFGGGGVHRNRASAPTPYPRRPTPRKEDIGAPSNKGMCDINNCIR